MQSDLPHTLYLKEGFNPDKKGTAERVNPDDKAFSLQEEALRKAAERRAARARGDGSYKTDELFKK